MLDSIDKKILNILSKDAKASLKWIGNLCNLSGAAVHLRIKKLEEKKIITGSKSVIDNYLLGYQTQSFIGIYFDRANMYKKVSKALFEIPEVVECNYTTGNFSLLVKVICKDNQHLTQVLSEKIQIIEGIARTETFISLEQTFSRSVEY